MVGERHLLHDDEAARLRILLEHAPMHAALLSGDALALECGGLPGVLPATEPGQSLREALGATLGERWLALADGVRETGASVRERVTLDGAGWEISMVRVDARCIGVYARRAGGPRAIRAHLEEASDAIHALRNPIYGISAATGVLLTRTPDPVVAEVLEGLKDAADQAERGLGVLGDILATMDACVREES